MENLHYGKLIKAARKSRNMSQSVLGSKIGVGKTAISNYEKSEKEPPRNMLPIIAQALSYEKEDMINIFTKKDNANVIIPHEIQPLMMTHVPYDKDGNTDYLISNPDEYRRSSFSVPGDVLPDKNQYVCFKANDNSMQSDGISKNDHLFVKLTGDIPEKSIVLFKNKISGSYYVRRYFRDGHIVSMMPSVPEKGFSPIRYDERDNDYEIMGIVEKILTNIK